MSSWDDVFDNCKSRENVYCAKFKATSSGEYTYCDVRICPKMTKAGNITIDCSCGHSDVHIEKEDSYIYAVCHNCGSWGYLD